MPTGMLPQDIILNILSRQSVECLLRFRCLSKHIRSLIDSQEFIKMHLKRSLETDSNLSLILSGPQTPLEAFESYWEGEIFCASLDSLDIAVELDVVELFHPFKNSIDESPIIGSCNGLIALINSEHDLALWNPSTKEHVILPNVSGCFKNVDTCLYGFGYDAANDDYKLVMVAQFSPTGIKYTELAVYSLKTDYWRRIRVNFPYKLTMPRDGAFADDGHVHWLGIKASNGKDVIIAFDLKSEEFHEVQLPPVENLISGKLGSFRGYLYFSCLYNDREHYDIWIMKKSWTKSFSFPRSAFGICDYVKALAYSKSGDRILVHLFANKNHEDQFVDKWELYWYNLQNHRIGVIGVPQDCVSTMICVDSLVSLAAYRGRGVQLQTSRKKRKKMS